MSTLHARPYAERIRVLRRRWGRTVLGIALILHALGHGAAAIGAVSRIGERGTIETAADDRLQLWIVSILISITMTALLAGGIGALPGKAFARRWRGLAALGLLTSIVLLGWMVPPGTVLGMAINVGLLIAVVKAERIWASAGTVRQRSPRRARARMARLTLLTIVGAVGITTAARPVFLRWGSAPEEDYLPLPGDEYEPGRGYQILHAVDIKARPEQIWPWLAQIGQDRGGFYSYAWLENLFGLGIVNADRIVPAWQSRQIGEVLPATPPGWLGLIDHSLGWRITRFEQDRLLFLEKWGAFALIPIDENTTRFYIRTQGAPGSDPPLLWSPFELLIFQPAHFIMQRRMMLGIKERAERKSAEATVRLPAS